MSNLFNKYAEKAQHAINATPLGQYIPPQYQHHGGASGAQPAQDGTTVTTPPPAGGSQAPPQSTATQTAPSPAPATSAAAPPTANPGGTTSSGVAGVLRQHGFSSLQNQLRNLQVQYSKGPDRQVQLAITAQKSVSLQFEAAGRHSQVYSKELYLWGQEQPEDIKDVTDRLAYLNFVHGQLSTNLANQLDAARIPWKTARATEGTMGTLKQSGQATDAVAQETAVEKRNSLKLGEAARWKAIREYAEKLILLSQASEVLIDECLPTSTGVPYTAKQRTADVRSTLQQSLDGWQPNPAITANSPFKPLHTTGTLAPGFGETHRQELEHTPSVVDQQKADQEALDAHHRTSAGPSPTGGTGAVSTGINPAQLNNSPAPVPASTNVGAPHSPPTAGSPTFPSTDSVSKMSASAVGAGVAVSALGTSPPSGGAARPGVAADVPPAGGDVPAIPHPTIAETGAPVSSAGGPGPASGSLKSGTPTKPSPTWGDPPVASGGAGAKHETAEEEKKRLEREDRERFLRFGTGFNKPGGASAAGPSTKPNVPASAAVAASANAGVPTTSSGTPTPSSQPRQESAEEEKRRLEREERDRVLRGDGGGGSGQGQPPRGDNDPNADGEQPPPSYIP